ncbi:hypothetical protein JOF55_004495 [Haloactinomyces albus]|uniref:Uncharacterized protein n=1 Tax=Haloactinomyces albus TaxID=1352928 RepID=A0AAE4CNY8_9ACTN|nr:hypothetical protein [Haloactinomyces albus]
MSPTTTPVKRLSDHHGPPTGFPVLVLTSLLS